MAKYLIEEETLRNLAEATRAVSETGEEMSTEEMVATLLATAQILPNVVRATEQTLTDEQQNQVRKNIGAASAEGSVIPDYWKTAVDNLKNTIETLQNNGGADSFQFLWLSDVHGVNEKTKNLGAVIRYTMDKYNIPLVIASGDIMSQASYSSEDKVWNEYNNLNSMFAAIEPHEWFAVKGNHDGAWGSPVTIDGTAVYYLYNIGAKKIYNAIYRKQAKDRTRVFGDNGTYFYADVHGLRIFMLNAQTDGDSSADPDGYAAYNAMKNSVYGQEQLEWLSDSLKTMKSGQKAFIVSHQPISGSHDGAILSGILAAFNNKTKYSGNVTVSADYWGNDPKYANITINADFSNTQGKVIAYFHGHNHKDIIDATTYSFPRIAITTAGGDVRDSNAVERVVGTSTETAMDIVTINNTGIYMTRLGAGSDRSVLVDNTVVTTYSITNYLTNCTNSNVKTSAKDGDAYSATISLNTGCELEDITVKMGGVDVTSEVYADGIITINSITGNVVITAVAKEIQSDDNLTPNFTNLADPTSDDWKTDYRLSSGGISTQPGKTVTNQISCVAGDVIRVKGVEFVASTDRIGTQKADGTFFGLVYVSGLPTVDYGYEYADGVHVFTILNSNAAGFRCSFTTPADASQVIITVNEEITYGSIDNPTTNVPIVWNEGKTCSYSVGSSMASLTESSSYCTSDLFDIEAGTEYTLKLNATTASSFRLVGGDDSGVVKELCLDTSFVKGDNTFTFTPSSGTTKGRIRTYAGLSNSVWKLTCQ